MNVSLTAELEEFVRQKVKTGRYLSASEVFREALRLLEERDQLYEMRLANLKREIALGTEQADQGDLAPLDIDDIKAQGRKELANRNTHR